MIVIRVVTDLFFSSKVSEVCRASGIECVSARSAEQLVALLTDHPDSVVLVDLGLSRGAGPALAGEAVKRLGDKRVWGYYSHVATELLESAQALGVTQVLPRSRFFEELPAILESIIETGKAL